MAVAPGKRHVVRESVALSLDARSVLLGPPVAGARTQQRSGRRYYEADWRESISTYSGDIRSPGIE